MTPLFLDNDVIAKMASFDLLDDAIEVLGSGRAFVRILSTFKYRFGIANERRRLQVERQVGKETYCRIQEFQGSVGEISGASDELLRMFEDLSSVDAGEAQLFAAAADVTGVLVVTGDKRAVVAIARAEACKALVQSLEHRVICLEQVLREVIRKRGFEYTKQRVVPAVDCDSAIRAIFGMGLDAEEGNVARALDSYISDLRRNTGSLLWKPSL